ncbi:hypothetical protein [Mammaliicoccus sciuri]|uniref:hypothetical protein n=1 Tax=Mammaliicoccus sciuri TaxID=1296 RepID=UPI001E2D4C82|nr:hypothetical protein [Mammaliicoccus sciuri]MCD8898503.1 hypothetical protein [Mammaliicoccus sciuri]
MKKVGICLLYIVLPLVVVGLFIWQLDNLEKFFKQYPNAIDGATLVFLLITTTLSIVIAYKAYRNNIEQEIRKEQKQSKLLKISINRKTQKLRTRINTVNLEYTVKHEVEGIDLLYILMKEKNTQRDILEFKDILDKALSENPTDFTEEDVNLINDSSIKLENLAFMVVSYVKSEGGEINHTPQEVLGGLTVKKYIQRNIKAVTEKI